MPTLAPAVLYVCIPVHNEAATVGVLLWRLRAVLRDAGRDYEVVVYDDASTDATAEVLAPYGRVLPLTVLGGAGLRRGRSGATEALLRHVAGHSRYPRRDACLLLQGDFTDRPEDVPALLAAFDAGTDLVVGRRQPDLAQPHAERRLRRMGPWALRPLVRVEGVDDLLGGLRLVRVAVVRDLVRARGAAPLVASGGWAGAVELVVGAAGLARRVAAVDTPGRYDVRTRETRLDWASEIRALAGYAWRARGTRVSPETVRVRADRPATLPDVSEPDSQESPLTTVGTGPAERAGVVPAARDTPEERPRRTRGGRSRRATPPTSDDNLAPGARQLGAGDAPLSSASPLQYVERPRVVGRARRARHGAGEPDGLSTERALEPPHVGAEAAPGRDIATPGARETAVTDAATGEAAPAHRRKRRTRRRSRDPLAADPLEAAREESTGVPERDDVTGDGPSVWASLVTSDHHARDDASDPEADDAEPGASSTGRSKRRRRRRARGRSAEGGFGVSDQATENVGAEALHERASAAEPPTPPAGREPADRQLHPE